MNGVTLKSRCTMLRVARNKSFKAKTYTNEVSFTKVMVSLDKGGKIFFHICGNTMRRMVCGYDMPKVLAASYWPRPIAKMPPRKISAK